MQTLNTIFYIKKDKTNEEGKAPIYCRVTIDGKSATCTTGEWVFPARWNETNHLHNSRNKEEVDSLNELKRIESKLKDAKRIILDREHELNVDTLLIEYRGETTSKMLSELCDHFLKIFREKVKAEKNAEGTYEKYDRVIRFYKEFLFKEYKIKDISLKKLRLEHIDNFDLYLRNVHKCQNNSTVKYCYAIAGIVKFGIKNDWLTTSDPFKNYQGKIEDVETIFLNDEELEKIENKVFNNESLDIVRDQFLFSCYTSYAPCDVALLEKTDVITHIDGEKWIFTDRLKTHIKSDVMLLPPALALIEKYKNHPECVVTGKLFPKRSNAKLNQYLKCIADLCGIEKDIHYYVSRHTFATTVTLSKGVPIETVGKVMGHKRLTTTQHYAKVLNLKVSNDFKKLKHDMQQKQSAGLSIQKQA